MCDVCLLLVSVLCIVLSDMEDIKDGNMFLLLKISSIYILCVQACFESVECKCKNYQLIKKELERILPPVPQ